jgi:hypothetical protein
MKSATLPVAFFARQKATILFENYIGSASTLRMRASLFTLSIKEKATV